MSYNNRSDNFSVTSNHDGSRSFRGNQNYKFNHGSSRDGSRGRGSGNSRGGRRPTYRNFNAGSARYGNRLRGNEDAEGDVSMSGDSRGRSNHSSSYRSSRGRSSRGSYRGRTNNRRPTSNSSHTRGSWHKVTVPFGSQLSQKELYGLITENIGGTFEPVQYSTDDKRAYFFVNGAAAAESIRMLSRRITKPDGHKLIFHVAPSPPPVDQNLSDTVIEKLKLRMSARYDPATQLLNLSSLYTDEVLSGEGINLPLSRVSTMSAVTKIITEHIPELSGLDFSNNRLTYLGHMAELVKGTPNLVSLNMGKNQLHSVDDLVKIKGWTKMAELVLDGNELCDSFANQQAYVSAVRKTFPKIMRLDGAELPPPITFDLDIEVKLPKSQGSYFFNDDIKNLVVTFIKEYISIYDSDRRRDLMPAYHENALLSVCVSRNPMFEKQLGFHSYFDGSRNLVKIGHFDQDKLAKRIHTGSLHVIAYLETLPSTTHDINSFKVDVSIATPTMLSFVLHGVFKENDRSDKLVRTFSRSFVTVPSGPGMVIINDMLTISNAGYTQTKNAFKSAAPTPSSSPVPGGAAASSSSAASGAPGPFLTPEQTQMVEKFVLDSGMISSFSLKCLQENAWDYQRAGQVFTELHSQGKIPPEAFGK